MPETLPVCIETDSAYWMVHVPPADRHSKDFDPRQYYGRLAIEELDATSLDELTVRLLEEVEDIETNAAIIRVPVATGDGDVSYVHPMHRQLFVDHFRLVGVECPKVPPKSEPPRGWLAGVLHRSRRETGLSD